MSRTLAEMRARVRTKLRDVDAGSEWTDATIDDALADGYETLWVDLMETEARNLLRTVSAAQSLVADQEDYDLPADCQRVIEVQGRRLSTDDWAALALAEKVPNTIRSGSDALFGSQTAGSLYQLRWTMRTDDPNEVRIHPALASVSTEQIRFVYYAFPVFPLVDAGTLKNPDAGETDTYPWIPALAEAATEYAAIADLADEELDDRRQQGTFAARYFTTVTRIARSSGIRFRPPRRYIKHTSSRPY